jgi:lycopene beta-cyclase
MPRDVDLLILGGGCAGLSLAMQLAQHGHRAPSTLILEQRACYVNDRTWCFWGDDTTPFAEQAAHQWAAFQVVDAGETRRLACADTPYRMLTAEQFYRSALAALAPVPQMRLHMASPVTAEPWYRAGRWHVETPDGPCSARSLVDTRAQRPLAPSDALMWQSFTGLEIECAQSVFEPSCVELMNFSGATPQRVGFTYVLPLSATRALVEFTVFAEMPFTPEDLEMDLHSAIAQRVHGAAYTVHRSEHGILPMGLMGQHAHAASAGPGHVQVGLFAGAARPATGYAFQRIQRWAAACAHVLVQGGVPIAHPQEPALRGWMDQLFLKVLRRQPALGPELFMAMFAGVSTPRVIRFMGEGARLSDCAAIACALPPRPFLRQLFSGPRWS